jgi:hypothetical protein
MSELNSFLRRFDDRSWHGCYRRSFTGVVRLLHPSSEVCRVKLRHSRYVRSPASSYRVARKTVRLRKRKKSLFYVPPSIFQLLFDVEHVDMNESDESQESEDSDSH